MLCCTLVWFSNVNTITIAVLLDILMSLKKYGVEGTAIITLADTLGRANEEAMRAGLGLCFI